MSVLPDLGRAPELTGISTWINSEPLTLASLRGKVVLVHFWTFGCINCRHVQPHVNAWFHRYGPDDFVVVGVHTPELACERDLGNLRAAIETAGVRFPVAVDPEYRTWDYDEAERVIGELLDEPAEPAEPGLAALSAEARV